jgi:hypothetical protein
VLAVTAAAAACSQSYAETAQADAATPDASTPDDAPAEAAIDTDTATGDSARPPTFTELATGLTGLSGVAATETDVYFTELGPGNVSSVPIGGGAVTTITTGTGAPGPIVIAGGFLFWGDTGAASLSRRPLAGGTVSSAVLALGKNPRALAASADRIVVDAVDIAGVGEMQQYGFDFVAGPSVGGLANPFDVAVVGTSIYWTESAGARIGMGVTGNGTNQEIAIGETGCESIAASSAGVYWTRPAEGLVRTIVAMGAGATTLAAKELAPMAVAGDSTDVYWLTGDGLLRRKTLGQELPPATLAKGFSSAFFDKRVRAIALTSQYVVWITTDGRVLRTNK